MAFLYIDNELAEKEIRKKFIHSSVKKLNT